MVKGWPWACQSVDATSSAKGPHYIEAMCAGILSSFQHFGNYVEVFGEDLSKDLEQGLTHGLVAAKAKTG